MGKFSQIIFKSISENPEEMHQTYYARKKLPDPLSFITFIGKPA